MAVNAFPSVVFPSLLVFNFRQMSFVAMLGLMVTHAIVTVAAAAFGYLAVIALRETLVAVLGPRWFTRVSPWAQGALIVMLGGSLLLLPPAADRIAQRGFEGWRAMSPPMWFLGAYEMTAGGVIADLPRSRMTPRQANNDQPRQRAVSASGADTFPALARRAGLAVGLTFLVAAAAYLWNARRLPSLAPAPPPAFRRRWRLGGRLANALVLRDAAARAGFYFTLAAMWRSNTHRLTLACAAAAGLAMAVVALSSCERAAGRRRLRAASVDAAAALRRAARRLPPCDPRAGGAARQLGLSARVARPRPRVRRRREVRRRRGPRRCRPSRPCCRSSCSCSVRNWR